MGLIAGGMTICTLGCRGQRWAVKKKVLIFQLGSLHVRGIFFWLSFWLCFLFMNKNFGLVLVFVIVCLYFAVCKFAIS